MENPRIIPIHISKLIIDWCLLAAVGLPILFLFLWGEPFQRGFFCNDESLSHPFSPSTIPSIYLYIFGGGVTSVVIITTEILKNINKDNVKISIFGREFPYWVWKVYIMLAVFVFGCFCSQLITDIFKYTVGRLRPHFLPTCVPNINCTLPINQHKYFENFTCTNPEFKDNKRIMKELRLSFPSGHSSFAMFAMVYFSIYLHVNLTWEGSKFLKHTLQFLALSSALYTGMTRISDYKHHWSDVFAGLSMGTFVAILISRFVSPLFEKPKFYHNNIESELSSLNTTNVRNADHV